MGSFALLLTALSRDLTRINHQIRASQLRVIDEDGANLGVMTLSEALARAETAETDLIEISPNAVPPIAKIMDYGKYQYLQNKKDKITKASGIHTTETKTLQVKIGTGEHDLEMKAAKASNFLKDGHRLKLDLFLPGRAKYLNQDFLKERLERFLRLISENYKIADPAKKSPKGMTIVIERDKSKKIETPKENENQ